MQKFSFYLKTSNKRLYFVSLLVLNNKYNLQASWHFIPCLKFGVRHCQVPSWGNEIIEALSFINVSFSLHLSLQRILFIILFICFSQGNTFILMAGSPLIGGPVERSDGVWERISVCSKHFSPFFCCCSLPFNSLTRSSVCFQPHAAICLTQILFMCLLRFSPHLC